MKNLVLIIALLLTAHLSIAQRNQFVPVERTDWHQLGDQRITVRTAFYGKTRSSVFINLHHNELTSLRAAQTVLAEKGGILISIENDNERFIDFSINGHSFRFDPNRIFTDAGIQHTLQLLNKNVTPSAIKAVRRFAAFLKVKIPATAKAIVALHNNEEGDLSIDSYVNGGKLDREAQRVHQSTAHDADDFFLTTSSSLFNKLKKEGYNVVLQHNKKATDDGSLSVYFGLRKKNYVNVEAEQGHFIEQQEMLAALIKLIGK